MATAYVLRFYPVKRFKKRRPKAAFTFEVDGLEVVFTDTSTKKPTRWLWDFGDGTTSTLQNPTHTYAESGDYTVTLFSYNKHGASTYSNTVSVASGNNYAAVVEATNPVIWFRCNVAATTQPNLGSYGASKNGTAASMVFSQAGQLGAEDAVLGAYPNSTISIPAFDTGGDVTLGLLVKAEDTLTTVTHGLLFNSSIKVEVLSNGRLKVNMYDINDATTATALEVDVWTWVFLRYNSVTGKYEFLTSTDGTIVKPSQTFNALEGFGFNTDIAISVYAGVGATDNLIDEVIVWDRQLDDTTLGLIAAATFPE